MDYEELKREYAKHIEEELQTRRDHNLNISDDNGIISPKNFAYFTAGIPIADSWEADYTYTGLWDHFLRPVLERAKEREFGQETQLVYGGYKHDGVLHDKSSLLVINDDKYMTITKSARWDNREELMTAQVCEDGVYVFRYLSTYANDTPWKFEFYSNEAFESSAKRFELSIEEIKRRFAAGYSYSVQPTKVWSTPASIAFRTKSQQIPCDAPTLNTENRYMIANKLFREGLDTVFKSGHFEITPEERKAYEEQAVIREEQMEQPAVEQQEVSSDYSLLSEEDTKKLLLYRQLQEMGVELSEEQQREMQTLQEQEVKTGRFREYQASREEREQHLREVMAERRTENEERNAHWMEEERIHQEKEERKETTVEKMRKETELLERLKAMMPLSKMQEVLLRLNQKYLEAYEAEEKQVELQQMTEEEKQQLSDDLSYYYANQK